MIANQKTFSHAVKTDYSFNISNILYIYILILYLPIDNTNLSIVLIVNNYRKTESGDYSIPAPLTRLY